MKGRGGKRGERERERGGNYMKRTWTPFGSKTSSSDLEKLIKI